MDLDVKLGFLEKVDIFWYFSQQNRWVWPENLYQQMQASYCGVVDYFRNVLLGNYA